MRVAAVLASVMIATLPAEGKASGEYCVAQPLVRGQPTRIAVPAIGKPFCGMARLEDRFVPLSEAAKARDEGPIECAPDGRCTRTVRYYVDEDRMTEPFIVILQGPHEDASSGRLALAERLS